VTPDQLSSVIVHALEALVADGAVTLSDGVPTAVTVERPRSKEHGDYATNVALQLAKRASTNPRALGEALAERLRADAGVEAVEVAGPGFLNITVAAGAQGQVAADVVAAGPAYGSSDAFAGEKINLEFVSANPTGPLHVGHGRQAALGDALASLLETQGHAVTREFYYNDAGVQIQNLALSVQARARGGKPGDLGWPEAAYNGEYILDIANDYVARNSVCAADGEPVTASGDVEDLDDIRRFAVTYLRHEQDIDLQKFGVRFDNYYLESSLYTEGNVEATVQALIESGKTYEHEGALWLRTTEYGDDKDRVMRKSDGSYTYFVPDVAYHITKWQRGFTKAVNIQGTDHHSTITRVRAGLQALNIGIPKDYPAYVLHSLVKVVRGGEEVKISKRAGSYVTLRDLIEWVGRDAVRFFLVSRRADSEFIFDIDLALAQSEENPVYYVQYAHARVCSVFKQLREKGMAHDRDRGNRELARLTEPHERALLNRLARYPDLLQTAAGEQEPHQVATYLRELAYEFHTYYNSHTFLVESSELRDARLNLIAATRQVLANGLAVLGVSAPESM
jgi:arginyl-tRNA synthetase